MNGSLAGMRDVSPDELKQLAHGVQVIDENKEFTFVFHHPVHRVVNLRCIN
jgi:hypothetical protein